VTVALCTGHCHPPDLHASHTEAKKVELTVEVDIDDEGDMVAAEAREGTGGCAGVHGGSQR